MSRKRATSACPRASATPPLAPPSIERFIDAAQAHGEQSEPDHEVGDLQSLARALWACLTPAQRAAFAANPGWEVDSILEWEDANA